MSIMPDSADIEARLNELLASAQKWRKRAEELEEALDAAVFQLDEQETRAEFLQERVEQLQDGLARKHASTPPPTVPTPPQPSAPAASAGPGVTIHPAYTTVEEWVDGWLSRHIEKDPSTRFRWCTRWREHPEALLRLEVMFSEYGRALADPRIGMGNFIRSGLDHHVPRLLAADGPFASCDPGHHEHAACLPTRTSAVAAVEGA